MLSPSGTGTVHLFQGGSNLQFNGSQFHMTIHGPTGAQANNFEYLHHLDAEVSVNAILNAGGRADEVRCFPGTREEVIAKAEKWMSEGHRQDRRIFWLSGPAGAGKSAIVQTLAERCKERGAAMANFFFFRADGSRNHSRPFVATLLRQLIKILPDLKALVVAIIAEDSLVFKTSLLEQLMTLIDAPIRKLRQETPNAPPIVLLIDGLDECDARPGLDPMTLSEQRALLNALHELATRPNSPFVVLVASRAEPHLVMAFNSIGRHQDSIYLDDNYRPGRDIQVFITAELTRIKRTHFLGQALAANWPSNSMINAIVERSSGQFIYASTIARFIANSSDSPAVTMEVVLNVRPALNHSPFAEIDAIYMFILSRSMRWEQASEIIAVHAIQGGNSSGVLPPRALGYSVHETGSFFSNLTSIIQTKISEDDIELTFYHASFNDFMYTSKRAGRFHIDLTTYANALAPRLILAISDYDTFKVATETLKRVNQRSKALTDSLTHLSAEPVDVDWVGHRMWVVKDDLVAPLKKLYATDAPNLYSKILNHMNQRNWIPADVYLSETVRPTNPVSIMLVTNGKQLSLSNSDGKSLLPDNPDSISIGSIERQDSGRSLNLPVNVQDKSPRATEKNSESANVPVQVPRNELDMRQSRPLSIVPKPKPNKWFTNNPLQCFLP